MIHISSEFHMYARFDDNNNLIIRAFCHDIVYDDEFVRKASNKNSREYELADLLHSIVKKLLTKKIKGYDKDHVVVQSAAEILNEMERIYDYHELPLMSESSDDEEEDNKDE